MIYVPLPVERIEAGRPLPVNVWDPRGNLLLRRGQTITSELHREHLAAHGACAIESDYKAWMHAYDRLIYQLMRSDTSLEQIARTPLPSAIIELDYQVSHDITGGWLDIQAVLHGLLYHGESAHHPLERLDSMQRRARQLIDADPDRSLFELFQMLPDPQLGYCATHSLLCAALCELTARKLDVPQVVRPVLFQAALAMNISMAREQDTLARQSARPDARQRELIEHHAQASADLLRGLGAVNEDLLDIVALHHCTDESQGLARNLECRRILHCADLFAARIAARATRVALSAIGAARAGITQSTGEEARVNAAMTQALGFYPPGTYVTLANGEKAVSVLHGAAANTPLVVSLLNAQGLALSPCIARDTSDKTCAVLAPLSPDSLHLTLHREKIDRAIDRLQGVGI